MRPDRGRRSRPVLVTGAAGFLGSNLVDALLAKGYRVVGLDTARHGAGNLEAALASRTFLFIRGDVTDAAVVRRAARGAKAIVHFATKKIPKYGGTLDTLRVNRAGIETVLETASRMRPRPRVLFASTSDVYGQNPHLPFSEESRLVIGRTDIRRWAYAISKIFGESLGFAYREAHRVPFVSLRLFGMYGPREILDWRGGPQSVFIDAALRGEPLIVHGDGRQTRSFTFVDDAVDGVIRALESPRAEGQVFNIGHDREIAIRDLARLVIRLCREGVGAATPSAGRPSSPPRIRFISHEKLFGKFEEIARRVPDCRKARRVLGWRARVGLEEGLRRTIAWHRSVARRSRG